MVPHLVGKCFPCLRGVRPPLTRPVLRLCSPHYPEWDDAFLAMWQTPTMGPQIRFGPIGPTFIPAVSLHEQLATFVASTGGFTISAWLSKLPQKARSSDGRYSNDVDSSISLPAVEVLFPSYGNASFGFYVPRDGSGLCAKMGTREAVLELPMGTNMLPLIPGRWYHCAIVVDGSFDSDDLWDLAVTVTVHGLHRDSGTRFRWQFLGGELPREDFDLRHDPASNASASPLQTTITVSDNPAAGGFQARHVQLYGRALEDDELQAVGRVAEGTTGRMSSVTVQSAADTFDGSTLP